MRQAGEYSVWVFVADGAHFPIERGVDALTAVRTAKMATEIAGRARRIIVTDGGGETTFEWRRGRGITFPTREQCT